MLTALTEYRLLLPQHLNGGAPLPTTLRADLEGAMCARFRGFTVARGLEGAWVAPDGRRFDDRADEYRLAAADPASVVAFAREAGALCRQEAMFLALPGGQVRIVPVPRLGER